jgi:hypothetical protein
MTARTNRSRPRRSGYAGAVATAVILAALAAPAARAADWSLPQRLVRFPLFDAFRIDGAGNASGFEAFAWFHTTHTLRHDPRGRSGYVRYVQARTRDADGRLGPIHTVSRKDVIVDGPLVGVDRHGTTTVAWEEYRRARRRPFIMVAVARRGHAFGRPAALGRGASEPETGFAFVGFDSPPPLAVAPNGRAVLAWAGAKGVATALRPAGRCRARRARACFGATRSFALGGAPVAAIGSDGTAAVAGQADGIWVATARPGRRLGAPKRVSPAGQPATSPALATTRDGTTTIVWRQAQADSNVEVHPGPVMAATRDAQGRLSDVQTVDPGEAVHIAIAINRQGEAILRWGNRVAARPPGGVFGPPLQIGPASIDPDVAYRQLAVDRHGRAVVAYPGAVLVRPALGAFGPLLATPGSGFREIVAAGDKVTTLWLSPSGATRISDLP